MKKILTIVTLTLLISSCGATPTSGPIATPEPNTDPTITQAYDNIIELSEKSAKTEDFSKIRSCEYDFNSDGQTDTVTLYSNAKTDEDGKIMWDDFHQWLLEVSLSDGGFYTLFDNPISTGQLYFEVSEIYNDEVSPAVTVFLTTGSSLDVTQFIFDGQKFSETKLYSTENASKSGINRIYSSIPLYK